MNMKSKSTTFNAFLLPILSSLIVVAGILFCLYLAHKQCHYDANVPYISHVGDYPPESGVYIIITTTSGMVMLLFVIVRHKQISELHIGSVMADYANNVALVMGFFIVFGFNICCSFRSSDFDPTSDAVHALGAIAGVGGGYLYCYINFVLTFHYLSVSNNLNNWLFYGRMLVNTFGILCSLVAILMIKHNMALAHLIDLNFTQSQFLRFKDIAGVFEWIGIFILLLLLATFSIDLKYVQFSLTLHEKNSNGKETRVV